MQDYQQRKLQSRQIAQRMRMGNGMSNILGSKQNPTHYIDALERFQKDYAKYQKNQRQRQKIRRQAQLQRRKQQYLDRQNTRWKRAQTQYQRQNSKVYQNLQKIKLGIKRSPNSNGLAFNPINLQYEKNPQGQKLRFLDEQDKIRGYVRAHNMQFRGNSKYNPLNGGDRLGIDQVVPQKLHERYQRKLYDHYDHMKLKIPTTSQNSRFKKFQYH